MNRRTNRTRPQPAPMERTPAPDAQAQHPTSDACIEKRSLYIKNAPDAMAAGPRADDFEADLDDLQQYLELFGAIEKGLALNDERHRRRRQQRRQLF